MTKICITSSGPTLDSMVDPRFGRCPYFIIADSETYDFEAVSNEAAMASGGAGVRAAQTVASKNVQAVLTGSVGPNAFPALQDAGIKILADVSGTVKSAIENYNQNGFQELVTPGPSNVGKGQGGPGRGLGMGRGSGMGRGRGRGGGQGRHRGEKQVTTRLLIPTQDMEGSEVADHFGRAPYFAVIDLDENGTAIEMKVHPNAGEHTGGRGHAHTNVLKYQPHTVIVQGMGPRGITNFQSQNIAVLRANSKSILEIIQAYHRNELKELTEGCADAHHK